MEPDGNDSRMSSPTNTSVPQAKNKATNRQIKEEKPVNQQNTGQTEGVKGDNDPNSDQAWGERCHTAYPSQSCRLGKHGVNEVQHISPAGEMSNLYKLGKTYVIYFWRATLEVISTSSFIPHHYTTQHTCCSI